MGVRSSVTDAAVGLGLNLRSPYRSYQDLARKHMGKAAGVVVGVTMVMIFLDRVPT